ncbi:CBS domain-containing protein [Epilithonimonas sp.]|uniref:CBS domain-containing protein n=1 Tax=Epilithonimonas sp. TaxID=2894511 RepID=UPI002FDDACBF
MKGILDLDDVRPYLFNKETESLSLRKLMKAPPAIINPENKTQEILQIFDDTGYWNLPVVDGNKHFIGFISKSAILIGYRQLLKLYSE